MPLFFETFPTILLDVGGFIRADIPFRWSESRYSIEQIKVYIKFLGGLLCGIEYRTVSLVKFFCRGVKFGQIFIYDRQKVQADGVFRFSFRGWYTYTHICLTVLFFYGHLWHSGRALFKDLWSGVSVEFFKKIDYGLIEKLGT